MISPVSATLASRRLPHAGEVKERARPVIAPSSQLCKTPSMTHPALAAHSADALLFDLGRVVLDIDFSRVAATWAAHAGCEPAELLGRFTQDDAYRRHERGEISDEAFFAGLRTTLGIAITDAQFLEGWNGIFVGEMPGIENLLARAAGQWPLYAFSNTNAAHAAHFIEAHTALLGHFRKLFLSSSIGLRKPEPDAFAHVVEAIGVPAERIVFFDDLIENVEAARGCGLIAVHVTSPETVATALAQLGLADNS
ncbi:HAD family phosphatase [soil metagenome]